MRHVSPLHVVNAALVFGVLLSVADVGAQSKSPPGGKGQLVNTACNLGQVTLCGEEPTKQLCTYKFDLNVAPKDRAFGFNFGGWDCVSTGRRELYKDFYEKSHAGVCVSYPRFPTDGVFPGRPQDGGGESPDDGAGSGSGSESC